MRIARIVITALDGTAKAFDPDLGAYHDEPFASIVDAMMSECGLAKTWSSGQLVFVFNGKRYCAIFDPLVCRVIGEGVPFDAADEPLPEAFVQAAIDHYGYPSIPSEPAPADDRSPSEVVAEADMRWSVVASELLTEDEP